MISDINFLQDSGVQVNHESCDIEVRIGDLKRRIHNFEGCSAIKTIATNTVISDGDPASRIMLVGEAPGEQEDRVGVPFCGRSGKLLNNMLEAIGLSRNTNIYITNSVFWRPPGNRNPTEEEIDMCLPFVEEHIGIINPKLLVLVGGVAMRALMQTTESVTNMRGTFHKYINGFMNEEIDTMILYHPSYLLRQPRKKAEAWKDLQMIRQYIIDNIDGVYNEQELL